MRDPPDPASRELIGIAAAIAGHCQPCFAYHCGKAREIGVPAEAIRAAMQSARAVRGSGDRQMDELAGGHMLASGTLESDVPKP